MFRNRRTSQKPSDELYKNFKANFPHLVNQFPGHTAAEDGASAPPHTQIATSLVDALDVPSTARPIDDHSIAHDNKDAEPTPRLSHDAWNFPSSAFTPSVMDPSSHSFNMFAQMPGYYTPTPGGTNTLYHNQAGDLHTPGLGMGMNTPLSLPTSEGTLHVGQQAFHPFQHHFQPHLQSSQHFQNVNPFPLHATPAYAPQQFSHQNSFDSIDGAVGESPIDDIGIELDVHHHQQQQQHDHSPGNFYQPHDVNQETTNFESRHPAGDHFRYHVTLNAPTAMVKTSDEVPITYLNKGQAYALTMADTRFPHHHSGRPRQYRTFVRVSFEDEQQRQKPAACWQLWKEGRGTNEAHQRGGRLQAVEFVDPTSGHSDESKKPRIELQESSFDGFCVLWSPAPGSTECSVSVRFNFLSTDFSHSKGVKGIPVRLCAKTQAIDDNHVNHPNGSTAEVCYCKVKLFRDHGAERKLSNDVAHVKKTIDKLNQQIAQMEQGWKDFGKRKRSGSVARNNPDMRPNKMLKHRRTWSTGSTSSNHGRTSAEDDMHAKLKVLQDMFSSTRTSSVLYLLGDVGDDPDASPVTLTGGDMAEIPPATTGEATGWEQRSNNGGSSSTSPTPSQASLLARKDSGMQQSSTHASLSRSSSTEWRSHPQNALVDIQPTILEGVELTSSSRSSPKHIATGTRLGSIQALGIDPTYKPPPERTIKPIACFFILPSVAGNAPPDHFYRAVYLMNRTLKDFVAAMARKCNIEPTSVFRTYRAFNEDTLVMFDDDCVRELPEGQAMSIDFCQVHLESPRGLKREWNPNVADIQCDGDVPLINTVSSVGYELRLVY